MVGVCLPVEAKAGPAGSTGPTTAVGRPGAPGTTGSAGVGVRPGGAPVVSAAGAGSGDGGRTPPPTAGDQCEPDSGDDADGTDANYLLRPGDNAGDSIPARGTAQTFTSGERQQINEIGCRTGCHSCGTTSPGTKSGNFVPDHQPVSRFAEPGTLQRLYPQCIVCSRAQGLLIARIIQSGA